MGRAPRLQRYGELPRAHGVAVLLRALPLAPLQQVGVVADLAQDVDARQRVAPVLQRMRMHSHPSAPEVLQDASLDASTK